MYAGVPVITSAVEGQSWLIQDNKEGIYTRGPDDVAGAVKGITYLVNNPSIRNRLGMNAHRKAKKYTRTKIIEILSKKLDELIVKDRQNGNGHRKK